MNCQNVPKEIKRHAPKLPDTRRTVKLVAIHSRDGFRVHLCRRQQTVDCARHVPASVYVRGSNRHGLSSLMAARRWRPRRYSCRPYCCSRTGANHRSTARYCEMFHSVTKKCQDAVQMQSCIIQLYSPINTTDKQNRKCQRKLLTFHDT